MNHLLLRFISTLLKLEISTLLKTITNSWFQARRVEISSFRRVEISKQTNAKADDSNLRIKTQKAVRRWGGECEWGLRLSFHKYFSSQDSTVSGFVAKIGKILRKVCKKNLKRIDGHENFYIEELTTANLRKQSGHCEFWYRDM